MKTQKYNRQKKGSILVLAVIFMVIMFGMLAFAVDIGYLTMVRTQLQRTADSAAIAATGQLLDDEIHDSLYGNNLNPVSDARAKATEYTRKNKVLNSEPILAQSDVIVGYLSNPFDPKVQMDTSGIHSTNAVQVRVQRTSAQNGVIPLSFARMLGIDQAGSRAVATAAFSRVSGFKPPSDGSNLGILPFALDELTWDALMAGTGTDIWTVDPETKQVTSGSDGIKEVNIFPQNTGASGNSGTINIGTSNNGTPNLIRQIENGLSASDIDALPNKQFALDENGILILPGNPGISAGMKGALSNVVKPSDGSMPTPRILPLYSTVSGNGANTKYTIVRFVGVRLLDVDLTGSKKTNKRVIIQPAAVIIKGGIPSTGGQASDLVFSPVSLVR
jgi:Flp pilus assembly protein TadG